jgi:enoyl-CoA hydratase/carnithine racemase
MCVAGGLELVLFLDLIWAAEGTNLGLLETRIGIVPLAGGIQRVAARAGIGRARSVALGATSSRPSSSRPWGVVDRVLPADELQPEAEKFARRLAGGPARAFAAVKQFAAAYTAGCVAAARRAPARGRGRPVRHRRRAKRDRVVPRVGARQATFVGR